MSISFQASGLHSMPMPDVWWRGLSGWIVQWSANVGIGLEYRIWDFMGIYVDPRLTYFFDCDQPYSVRTEQPLQFNLELGFRFHI